MEASLIKNGDVLVCKYIATPSNWGYRYGGGIIIPGCRVKVIRKPTQDITQMIKCMVLPFEEDNGPIYVNMFPSQLARVDDEFEPPNPAYFPEKTDVSAINYLP